MDLKVLQKEYLAKKVAHDDKKKAIEEKIVKLEKQIERLKTKRRKLEFPRWTDELLLPVLNALAEQTPDLFWGFQTEKEFHTFGMRAECPVIAYDSPERKLGSCVAAITFTPQHVFEDTGDFGISYDTGETLYGGNRNHVKDPNGFGSVRKPIESIEELVIFVRKQVAETLEFRKNNPQEVL